MLWRAMFCRDAPAGARPKFNPLKMGHADA
jgi:hypothetical protein